MLLELGPEAFGALLGVDDRIPEAFARLANERAQTNQEAMAEWAAGQVETDTIASVQPTSAISKGLRNQTKRQIGPDECPVAGRANRSGHKSDTRPVHRPDHSDY